MAKSRKGMTFERHGMSKTRLYQTWADMKRRCDAPYCSNYSRYGALGVSYAPEWKEFASFMAWAMANGYKESLTIERIDVTGNYRPDNCTWVTKRAQNTNKKSSRKINFMGLTLTMAEWAAIVGISRQGIRQRLNAGWPADKIILTPARR